MTGAPSLPRRVLAASALVVVLASVLAACGDDGDNGEGVAKGKGGEEAGTGQAVRDYCEKSLRVETYPEPEIDFESLTAEQQVEEAKKFAKQIQPLAEEVRAAAPADVKGDITVLADTIAKLGETGDFELLERPEVAAAEDRAHAYDLKTCGWTRADVTAVEYAFQGVPPTLRSGPASFDLTNRGKEPHELVIFRIHDDVKEPLEKLLDLPEEEARTKVTDVGGTFAEPGDDGYKVADLEPGRYGMACFVPVAGGEEGPPHTSRGMFAEFKVE